MAALWLGASKILRRPVSDAEPYPHVCGRLLAADDSLSGRPVRLDRRDCAACTRESYQRQHEHSLPAPPSVPADTSPAAQERTRSMSDNPLLTAALAHAGRGWHVFPLRPDDKRPAFPDHAADDCNGRDPRCRAAGRHLGWEPRATTDPDRIRRAWTARPYGIGVACGPSRLVVIDLDVPKDGTDGPTGMDTLTDLAATHGGTVEPTFTVRTGRGGTHLYYRHPKTGPALRNTAGTLGSMVDTRAAGGYVVAAGSTVAGRPYTVEQDTDPAPLHAWLADLLAPAPLPPQRPVVVDLPGGRERAYVRTAVDRECARVTSAPDHHNDNLYRASVALGQLVAGGALSADEASTALEHAGAAAGLRQAAVLRTIASGFKAGAARPRQVAA
ncbi:bifunctional DNA primase/polymerase [Polymorphospora sp. NPDC051019]|uniref:bifunctional DNA primase/polymerase n=1 Tax=Polymorphospora sp. NPDC051019 TaxID=3155725 RepID=UPI0034411718